MKANKGEGKKIRMLEVKVENERVWFWIRGCGFIFPESKLKEADWRNEMDTMIVIAKGLKR